MDILSYLSYMYLIYIYSFCIPTIKGDVVKLKLLYYFLLLGLNHKAIDYKMIWKTLFLSHISRLFCCNNSNAIYTLSSVWIDYPFSITMTVWAPSSSSSSTSRVFFSSVMSTVNCTNSVLNVNAEYYNTTHSIQSAVTFASSVTNI